MARVINNFITIDEIHSIKEYFKNRSFELSGYLETGELHWEQSTIPEHILKEILHKKLIATEGKNYKAASITYRRVYQPYRPHVDSKFALSRDKSFTPTDDEGSAMIIPLDEGEYLNTVFWKENFATTEEMTQSIHNFINLPDAEVKNNNITSKFELDFCSKEPEGDPNRCIYNHYELDINFNWKLGTAVHWNRNQLHAATDFTKHVMYKDAVSVVFN